MAPNPGDNGEKLCVPVVRSSDLKDIRTHEALAERFNVAKDLEVVVRLPDQRLLIKEGMILDAMERRINTKLKI